MELEITLRVPVAGATLAIPTRQRVFDGAAGGGRVVDSVHVADVGGLQSVELDDGKLFLELRSGEKYVFPIAELLTGGKDKLLKLDEKPPGAGFGGIEQKTRLHEVQLAGLHSLRLVEPESSSTPERWERQPA
jgi:hypothetical protein